MKPFPWFGWRERARARDVAEPEPDWLDGERVMPEQTATSDCIACGTLGPAEHLADGGLRGTYSLCREHTQEIAARALRRMLPKLVRQKLERP